MTEKRVIESTVEQLRGIVDEIAPMGVKRFVVAAVYSADMITYDSIEIDSTDPSHIAASITTEIVKLWEQEFDLPEAYYVEIFNSEDIMRTAYVETKKW